MSKSHQIAKSAKKGFNDRIDRLVWHSSLTAGLAGILLSLLTGLLSIYVSTVESAKPNVIPLNSNLLYFVAGIILLGVVIVIIASFLRRKNRDVILLRRHLSEVYLLALRKSALNPESHVTSND